MSLTIQRNLYDADGTLITVAEVAAVSPAFSSINFDGTEYALGDDGHYHSAAVPPAPSDPAPFDPAPADTADFAATADN
jgi:hypothetical protein